MLRASPAATAPAPAELSQLPLSQGTANPETQQGYLCRNHQEREAFDFSWWQVVNLCFLLSLICHAEDHADMGPFLEEAGLLVIFLIAGC